MREEMGLTKEDKKKQRRKRNRKAKKEQKRQKMEENNEDENDGFDSDDNDDEDEEKGNAGIVEININKGKRKYGDESEDSDEDLSYEQYLEEVQAATKKRRKEMEGVEDDDAAIKKYGVLLGLNEKMKDRDGILKVPKSMKSDGLDLLLDFCDHDKRKNLIEKETNDDEDDEEEDVETDKEENDDMEINDDIDMSEGEDIVDEIVSEDEDECEDEEVDDEMESDNEDEEEVVEDIYGRKINKGTGELIKFDPAAARRKLEELDKNAENSSSAEQKAKVDRAVTGIINRLSDSTLIKSQQGIAELWATHSKNDVKNSLHKILTKVLSSTFRVQDSLLTTYGAFMAMCHSMISDEISAHFVEVFLCDMVKLSSEEHEDDKSNENRNVFVAMLVVFRIIQPSIIVEVIDKYAENLTLYNLKSVHILISYCYKSLKKSCWSVVTEKIEYIVEEFSKKPISSLPRAKFLMDEVSELKKQSPKTIDYSIIERQVKVLQGLAKKKGGSLDAKELGMTLNDLLNADKRGRWWIVGSAFRLPDQGGYGILASEKQKKLENSIFPKEIVDLAGKAGMNSEIRRNIFCTVATAEDEDDAFERLLKLGLKGERERELVHVLVVMMTKEKTFNQFYGALLQRFCEFNKRFVITLQYALWDRLRECDSLKVFQRNSLAQLLQYLLANEVMAITVLKSIEWATRWPSLTSLLKKMFLGLAKCPESVLRRIFEPVISRDKRAKFELLSEGMRVFWHMHLNDCEAYKKVDKWIMESGYD